MHFVLHRREKQPKGFAFLQHDHNFTQATATGNVCSLIRLPNAEQVPSTRNVTIGRFAGILPRDKFCSTLYHAVWTLTSMNLWKLNTNCDLINFPGAGWWIGMSWLMLPVCIHYSSLTESFSMAEGLELGDL